MARVWSTDQRRFMVWLATPKKDRTPKTQIGWAKENGYRNEEMSRWKNIPGFMQEVEKLRMKYIEKHLSDLYDAAIQHAMNGNHNYFRMLIELVKDRFNTQTVVVEKVDDKVKKMTEEEIVEEMYSIFRRNGAITVSKDEFMAAVVSKPTPGEA